MRKIRFDGSIFFLFIAVMTVVVIPYALLGGPQCLRQCLGAQENPTVTGLRSVEPGTAETPKATTATPLQHVLSRGRATLQKVLESNLPPALVRREASFFDGDVYAVLSSSEMGDTVRLEFLQPGNFGFTVFTGDLAYRIKEEIPTGSHWEKKIIVKPLPSGVTSVMVSVTRDATTQFARLGH